MDGQILVDGFHEVTTICDAVQISCVKGEHLTNGASANSQRAEMSVWFVVVYHSITVFNLLKLHQFGKTVFPGMFFENVWYAGGRNLERSVHDRQTLRSWRRWKHQISTRELSVKEVISPEWANIYIFPVADGSHEHKP